MTDLFTIAKCLMVRLVQFHGQWYLKHTQFLAVVVWAAFLASGNCLSITSHETQPPLLKELQAECNTQGIQVKLWFKKPFSGVAYSNGHYETKRCRYISHGDEDNSEDHEDKANKAMESSGTNFSFLIPMNECGTVYYEGASGKEEKDMRSNKSNGYDVYIENTLLIQRDSTIQEADDVAKTLRCVWQKQIRQPLMASLPIGNMKMSPSKLFGGLPQRVKTITATMHKSRPIPEDKGSSLSSSNSSQTSTPRLNLRFQKKGQVQSVPFNERRQHARAMVMNEDDISEKMKKDGLSDDLVSALPLQRHSVASVAWAQRNNQGFSVVLFVIFATFWIPARIQ